MKRLMLISRDEFIKYQHGLPCYVNAVLPSDERLDYMKIIVKTYTDMMGWKYIVVIGDDDKTEIQNNLDHSWFKDCEDYIKRRLTL